MEEVYHRDPNGFLETFKPYMDRIKGEYNLIEGNLRLRTMPKI